MINKLLNIIKKYKNKDISRVGYTDNYDELQKLPKDNPIIMNKGWGFEGYPDDSKYISCCENAKNDILSKIENELSIGKNSD
tara:strand:- start:25 stop:270 length:246 start_codon:yes stop_codon:yes gene_type:complete